ncbi:glutamate-tRNA ligase (EARS1) [Vairimorpha necatrix]|uniref:Probable glutamate--tRNA ligase, cytoplasmic n=1 Tax=Vairimorpha necatrix TaxID=6039 RepID=A0AAX4JGL8_9MICR
MTDTKKLDFLQYLLIHKYNQKIPTNEEKSLENYLKDLSISKDLDIPKDINLQDLLNPDPLNIKQTLFNLNDSLDSSNNLVNDIIFCLINSDPLTLKIFKDKDLPLSNLRNIYDSAFKSNKPFLKNFNTKDKKPKEPKNQVSSPLVTRFCPEPSGCLHIGHVKALLVNYNLATNSNGKLLLRFDDTNPIKDYERYEKEILKDLKTLNISVSSITHSSDYFDYLVDKALFLINRNLAYVDDTDQETMRNERFNGIESKSRNNTVDYNLEIFNKMLQGEISTFCLRAKIDMSNLNKTMRDPVIYRCTNKEHCRNDKYKAYPTYDFVCPLIDSLEGVTLVARADEYKDRNEQYKWFLNVLNLDSVLLRDFSKLNLADTLLSKRKIEKLIQDKEVSGWDDPRLSTVQGIKRLGLEMNTLKEYINLQGSSNKTNIITWDKIWAMNKKMIDPVSPRFMAVPREGCFRIKINNLDKDFYREIPLHKKNPSLGNKRVFFSGSLLISLEDALSLEINEEFTLMNWGNAIVKEKIMNEKIIKVDLNLEGDYKSTSSKISWISELGSVLVKTVEYENILKNDEINPDSKKEIFYYAEEAVIFLKLERHLQFERIGFYYQDSPFIFHLVPTTKQRRNLK